MAAIETSAMVDLGDRRLTYTLRRSDRSRRLRVTIDHERGVIVTIPPATRRGWARPEAGIEAFLRERESWLRRHLDRDARIRADLAARGGLEEGATIRFRGTLHRLRIVDAPVVEHRSRVTREGDESTDSIVVSVARRDRRPIGRVLEAWCRERAFEAIQRAIDDHAAALGVRPTAISLRDPRTRWGSATRKGRLSFSWRLVLAPPDALETVVVHELAHLRVFGHGPGFWALVGSRRSDHLVWRRWLRAHSQELHATFTTA